MGEALLCSLCELQRIALKKDSSDIPRPIFGKFERKFIEDITYYKMGIMKEARDKFNLQVV